MKVFLPVLLAALLGVERAHSLVCFSCVNKNSNWYCLKPTVCSDTDNYCVSISASAVIGNVVDFGYTLNKGYSPFCPIPSVNLRVASVDTRCCQSFLCNISAADRGLRASAAVLDLGLLLSLLSALLRFGPLPPGPCARPRLPKLRKEGKPSSSQTQEDLEASSPRLLPLQSSLSRPWVPTGRPALCTHTPAGYPYFPVSLPGEPGNGA